MQSDKAINYYNTNTQKFVDRTVHVNLAENYAKFLPLLPPKGKIVDAGCGSGRDTLYFKRQGFEVVACDASVKMVEFSTQLTGLQTLLLRFQDFSFCAEFDGVWASASILHTPYEEIPFVLEKIHTALKPSGIFYASFKYGSGKREADSRIFYDMNEKTILPYLKPLFTPLEIWVTDDLRSITPSPSKTWLHLLARKKVTIQHSQVFALNVVRG